MAIFRVDSNVVGGDGSGDSWANAYTNLEACLAHANTIAGSDVYIDDGSAYAYSANFNYASKGTFAAPINVYSVDKADDSFSSGAIEDGDNGAYICAISGFINFHEVNLKFAGTVTFSANNAVYLYGGSISQVSTFGRTFTITNGCLLYLDDVDVTFAGHANDYFLVTYAGFLCWRGGVLTSTTATNLIGSHSDRGGRVEISGVDLSSFDGAGTYFFDGFGTAGDECAGFLGIISSCKITDTNTPGLVLDTPVVDGADLRLVNCNIANVPYFKQATSQGTIEHDSAIYRAGADPSANNFSAKMVTTAQATYDTPLRYKLAERWCSANPTIVVEMTHDTMGDGTGGLLENDEVWLEIEYPTLNNAAYRQWDRTGKMVPLATPADQGSDAGVAWTGTGGFGTPIEQRLTVTIGDGAKPDGHAGVHTVWVCLGTGAVSTVYVCPQIDVS